MPERSRRHLLTVPDGYVDTVGRAIGALPETRFCAPVIAGANLITEG